MGTIIHRKLRPLRSYITVVRTMPGMDTAELLNTHEIPSYPNRYYLVCERPPKRLDMISTRTLPLPTTRVGLSIKERPLYFEKSLPAKFSFRQKTHYKPKRRSFVVTPS